MNELIVIKQVTIGNEEVNSVDARELHRFLESKQEFAHWIKAKVVNNLFFKENQDFILLDNIIKQDCNLHGGSNRKDYALSLDTAKKVAMAEQTARGNEVREYFIECERKLKEIQPEAFQLPKNFSEALRMLADEVDEKNRIAHERDEAIRTKAHVTAGREASMMGQLGAAKKKIYKLEDDLGDGKRYKTVVNIPFLKDYFPVNDKVTLQQIGKYLTRVSASMKIKTRTVEKVDFDVNSYHVDVIKQFKDDLDSDPNLLSKYRLRSLSSSSYAAFQQYV